MVSPVLSFARHYALLGKVLPVKKIVFEVGCVVRLDFSCLTEVPFLVRSNVEQSPQNEQFFCLFVCCLLA